MPYFNSKIDLLMWIDEWYGEDKVKAREKIECNSPLSLLLLFTMETFHGDFNVLDDHGKTYLVIKNREIAWHLLSIAKAMRDKSLDLENYYDDSEYFECEFHLDHSSEENSQAKLMYSLLWFCCYAIEQNYSRIIEVGGGEGVGGDNHYIVGNILSEMGYTTTLVFKDPGQTDHVMKKGNTTYVFESKYVNIGDSFEDPVFCDMFTHGMWNEVQHSIGAPLKMTKEQYVAGGVHMLRQPYHQERRGINVGECFFSDYITSNVVMEGFDNCHNCRLWKALIRRFSLDPKYVVAGLVQLGKKPCGQFAGQRIARRIDKRDSLLAHSLAEFAPVLPEMALRSVNRPQVGLKRVYNSFEYSMIEFMREYTIGVREIPGEGTLPLERLDIGFFSGGTPFYRRGLMPVSGEDCFIEGEGEIEYAGFERIASHSEGTRWIRFLRAVKPEINNDVLPIKPGARMRGYLVSECKKHCESYGITTNMLCGGATCAFSQGYVAVVHRNRVNYFFVTDEAAHTEYNDHILSAKSVPYTHRVDILRRLNELAGAHTLNVIEEYNHDRLRQLAIAKRYNLISRNNSVQGTQHATLLPFNVSFDGMDVIISRVRGVVTH